MNKLPLGTHKWADLNTPVRQSRKRNGRYSSFKSKAKKFIKGALWWGGSVSLAALLLSMYFSTTTVTATTPQVIDTMPQKVEELKAGVVNQISDCERAGHTEDDGIITFDTNGRASIGVMQFQTATVIEYEKSLYGKDISGKDAVLIALDASQAKALALDIVFKKDGLANWLNCANKLGLRAQVNAITKISN